MSPTVLREGPYRFYFYSHEPNEPPHIHVDRDRQSAKFWLETVAVVYNIGFSDKELGKIESILRNHRQDLLEAWNDYFGTEPG